ncbi:aldehyde dehydrogenase family protein [Streptomyces solisilvae]|uniref:aldehyde dehydrogenase family protein n=1 Tax=Streptomyces malaysiensis TaxID=92644 RepID=UPI00368BAA1D
MTMTQAPQSPAIQEFLDRVHPLFIGGEWTAAQSEQAIDVLNPATGETISRVQVADATDIGRAVGAARTAFDDGPWPQLSPLDRARIMLKLADLVEHAAPEIAYIETLDNGMPLASATRAVGLAVSNLRYFAGWSGKIAGNVHNLNQGETFAYTVREPIGVAGLITPWNFPFTLAVGKIAQALAAGCTVVLKPAELTPLSVLKLADLMQAAELPAGVVNIVPGLGGAAGEALVTHPGVDKISFTGSTATGKAIVRAATDTMKRVTLELGGKSPTFVFDDADLRHAIPGAAMAAFANSGQVCVAGSRLFVHRNVFDEVVDGIGAIADSLRIGPGLDPESQLGPLASQAQLDRVASFIDTGRSEGAEVLRGGEQIGERGYFIQPTVVTGTRPDMRLMRDEIFGPVVSAVPFDDGDDLSILAAIANDTEYGLAAYLWTQDLNRTHRLAKLIRAGTIQVNGGASLDPAMPFGGYKQSGWGREYGADGVEAYLETKSVIVRL